MYELPVPPSSGVVVDAHGITWRRNADQVWYADACPHCEQRLGGSLTWAQLLERGPITDGALP